jgi:hypothetical protein
LSYDLFLTPRTADLDAMRNHFAARPSYEVSGDRAVYRNEDTGAYFSFDFATNGDEGASAVAFELNYFRPHVFALEAEPEVRAFVEAFGCAVSDPQMEGMAEGPYSSEGFLRGWNAGNRFAFKAFGREETPPPPWSVDPALLEHIWRWNMSVAKRRKQAGEKLLVARIMWFHASGEPAPTPVCIWTHGVPTVIPAGLVSHILLVRQPRAGLMSGLRRMLGGGRADIELKFTPLAALQSGAGLERGVLDGDGVFFTPADTGAFAGDWFTENVRMVAVDQMCGSDLVALMKSRD